MTFDAFIGSSYVAPSVAWDAQRAFNLFIEADESGAGKSPNALLGTPGLALFGTMATQHVRGIWTGLADNLPGSAATDLMYVVAGSKLISVASNGTPTVIGDVGDDATHSPVTFQVNGTQILITSAGLAWVYDNTTLAQAYFTIGNGTVDTAGTAVTWVSGDQFDVSLIGETLKITGVSYTITAFIDETHATINTTAGTQTGAIYSIPTGPVLAAMSAFLDGYGIVLPPTSKTFFISAIDDFTRWNPLDFARKAAFPDNIASIYTDHEDLWLAGSETSEVWRNTGAADFPFERDPGAFIHQGTRAPFAFVSLANGVAWIGGDNRGNPVAWRATGYQPGRCSTHGVETAWASYSTLTDARGFVYTCRGHQFWVISFPTANATWVYDATAGQWHERGWWNGTSNDRTRYATHGYVFGKTIVGDWENGKLYELSESVYTDQGTAIHRYRTAPHLSNEELWTFYSQFRLACQAGLNPTLSWSDDQGVTWHAEVAASNRLIGGVSSLSVWRRLGKARDRVWRITITDAAKVALFAAYLDLEASS